MSGAEDIYTSRKMKTNEIQNFRDKWYCSSFLVLVTTVTGVGTIPSWIVKRFVQNTVTGRSGLSARPNRGLTNGG